jgi:hypothetical protein
MKTKFIIPVLFLFGMNAFAGSHDESGFVITGHDTTICNRVLVDFQNANIEMKDGSVMKVDKNKVLAFKSGGKYYEKREIYLNKKATGIYAFMEFISQRNGLKLFCYRFSDGVISDHDNNNISTLKDPYLLLVYKNNEFYLQLTKSNSQGILDFFHADGTVFD